VVSQPLSRTKPHAMLKLGDLVILKSGGYVMMVTKVDGNEAECLQFDGTKCSRLMFPLESLEPTTLDEVLRKPRSFC
jgi:uncharacterized protein YodC (DUF2158 family)